VGSRKGEVDMSETVYWIWLAGKQGIGAARAKALIEYFGTPENVYNSRYNDYRDIKGLNKSHLNELMDKDLSPSESIILKCQKLGYKILTISDDEYPQRLRNIYDPPLVLYIRGTLPKIDDMHVVGVVGTRRCTPYGVKNAQTTGYKLSQNGFVVVTGLAEGIDTAATRGALKGITPTVGVIGCGPDLVFPAHNRELFEEVALSGAVISEYSPGTPAVPGHFPSRNRIISGLSNGVAVIEAPARSGALITTERAMEEGRDVFVLPGNVDAATCAGSNRLLCEGAIPFITPEDIMAQYIVSHKRTKKPFDNNVAVDYIDLDKLTDKLNDNSKAIMKLVAKGLATEDEIIENTNIDAPNILSALTLLELDGYLRRDIMGRWEINS